MSLNAIKSKINLHYTFFFLKRLNKDESKENHQTLEIEKEEVDFNHVAEWKHAGRCLHHWSHDWYRLLI